MAESTGAVKAGKAYVEISARDKLLVRSLDGIKKKLKALGTALVGIGTKIAALGTVALAPFIASLTVYATAGDAMAKMSQRTGIAVEALSQLTYAAEQSGASAEVLEKGVRTMQRTIKNAEDGTDTAIEAFGQLGLTLDDLRGLSPDEQFKLIADRLSKIKDPAIRAGAAMEVFGKGGAELLPLMADGAKGIEMLMRRAEDLGLTMSGESANAAVAFGDHIADVRKQIAKVAFEIGAALAPALTDLAQRFQTTMKRVIDWVKSNRDAIVTAAKVAVGIIAAGAALIALGVTLKVVALAMTPLIVAAKAAYIVIGLLKLSIAPLAAAMKLAAMIFTGFGPILAFLISPMGVLTAAIGALGVALTVTSKDSAQAMGALRDGFNTLKDDAITAFGGIRDALASGDIAAAANILWLALKLVWERGAHGLNLIWQSVKDGVVSTWQSAVDIVAKLTLGLIAGLKAAWVNFTSFFTGLWESATSKITGIWDDVQGAVENTIHDVTGFFDSNFDSAQAKDINNRKREADAGRSKEESANRLAEIEKERVADIDAISKSFQDAVGMIDDDSARTSADRDKAAVASLEATAAELEAAKDALRSAVTEAKTKREQGELGGDLKERADFLKSIGSQGEDDEVTGILKKVQTRGTFNKFGNFQSLQGSGQNFAKQMVEEQRQAKDHLRRAIDLLGDIKLRLPAFS